MGDFAGFIFGLIVGFLLGFLTGIFLLDVYKEEAVELGHAYWEVENDGRTTFTWKDAVKDGN